MAVIALPVSPFPASLIFHSKPGAANVLFLNFSGEDVSGTQWNTVPLLVDISLADPSVAVGST